MNGMDMIVGLTFVNDSIVEEAEYGAFSAEAKAPEGEREAFNRFRRPLLVAAMIGLLLLLMGCTAYFYRLKHLVVIDHTKETLAAIGEEPAEKISGALPEAAAGPSVSKQVLSLQGYEGSPAYHALQEWLTYSAEYTVQNPELRFSDEFQRPEAYTNYPCYSQEMVDKVDELCIKYGLHLVGKPFFIPDAEGMAVHGLSGILKEAVMPRCFYGHLFQDGSFVAYGELDFSESYGKTVQFQMNSIKKDAFYTAQLGLNHLSDILQWNYTTAEGYRALLALNGDTGFIFAENGGSFISIIIGELPDANMVFTGLPREKPFLEAVCDSFVFSDVENE